MTGFTLFRHAVQSVFRNLDDALAISGLIWIGILLCQVLVVGNIDLNAMMASEDPAQISSAFQRMLLVNIVMMLGSCWVAVEWHLFILEGQRPNKIVPPWRGGRIWRYLLMSIALGLIVGLVIGLMSVVLVPLLGSSLGLLLIALLGLPTMFIFLRLSPVLPSVALGEKLRFFQAWEATKPQSGVILQVAVLALSAVLFVGFLTPLFGSGLVGLVFEVISGWVLLMINVSLLSSIYEIALRGQSHE